MPRNLTPLLHATGGGSERLRMVMEGESLLNDASAFTLFFVFTSYMKKSSSSYAKTDPLAKASTIGANAANANWTIVLGSVVKDTLVLGLGGWPALIAYT
jgi:NhaP-type Na+/H+ or K+/H+ antiporter